MNTAIEVLEIEILRLQEEEKARMEIEERERLAPLGAREQALKNIDEDRKRMKEKETVRMKPRYKAVTERLGKA